MLDEEAVPAPLSGMARYEKGIVLGEGTFGVVFKANDRLSEEVVAIKKIRLGKVKEGVNVTALREIKLLMELKHPNIIRLIDVFPHKRNLNLVFEFMESDLEAVIKDRRLHLGPGDIKSYLRMVLLALECCHANWVLHRDMKPNNLLIGPDGTLKLADFGLARIFGSPDRRFTHQVFARWYRAPELLFGAKCYGGGVDVWGVGCVMGELMSRLPMFEGSSDIDQLGKIFAVLGTPTEAGWPGVRALPDFVEYVPCVAPPLRTRFPAASDEAVALLSAMLTYDPNQRLTATAALAHPYFSTGPAATPPHALPRPQRAPGAGGGGARPAPGGAAGGAAGGAPGAPGGGAEGGGGAGGTKRAAPEGGGASPGTLRALAQRRSFPPPAAPSDGGIDGGAGSQSLPRLPRPPSRVPAGRSRFAPSSAGPRASDASMGATPSSPAPVPMSCLGGTGDSGAPLSGPYLSTGAAAMAGPRHAPDSTDLQYLRKRRLDAELDAAFDDVYDDDETPAPFFDDDDTPAPAEEALGEPDALCT